MDYVDSYAKLTSTRNSTLQDQRMEWREGKVKMGFPLFVESWLLFTPEFDFTPDF